MKYKLISVGFNVSTGIHLDEPVDLSKLLGMVSRASLLQPRGREDVSVRYQHLYNYNISFNSKVYRISMDMINRGAAVLLLPVAIGLTVIPLTAAFIVKPYYVNQTGCFFKQKRVGHMGNQFVIYKIKTLFHDSYYNEYNPCPWVRFLGLDELPQLLNIIKGDMAFWGGRPLRQRDLNDELRDKYLDYMNHRKPGMMSLGSLLLRLRKVFPVN